MPGPGVLLQSEDRVHRIGQENACLIQYVICSNTLDPYLYKSIQWNATNDRNEPVSAGLYLYTIQAGEFRQTKKMLLLK